MGLRGSPEKHGAGAGDGGSSAVSPRVLVGGGGGHDGGEGTTSSARRRRIRIPSKILVQQTRAALSRHVRKIAKKADEHEHLINKITYSIGVICFGTFCFLLGARPYDIPRLYAAFFLIATPLRWAYYKSKKWHYFLLDFCYYANAILVAYLVFFPTSEKLFLLCFAFSEGPLAWALIVWRCSLVFSSLDKIVSVLIHLMPGTVIFIIRWWDPKTFSFHGADETGPFPAWPFVPHLSALWLWMFAVPLLIYSLWQLLYYLIVEVLRRQRIVRDPEVMTSFRELSRKAARANNVWWRLSGMWGEHHRVHVYVLLQGLFTVATVALTVPMFRSYRLHAAFQLFKVAASVWNGGNFFFDVMPRQVTAKAECKRSSHPPSPLQVARKPAGHDGVSSPRGSPRKRPAADHAAAVSPIGASAAAAASEGVQGDTIHKGNASPHQYKKSPLSMSPSGGSTTAAAAAAAIAAAVAAEEMLILPGSALLLPTGELAPSSLLLQQQEERKQQGIDDGSSPVGEVEEEDDSDVWEEVWEEVDGDELLEAAAAADS